MKSCVSLSSYLVSATDQIYHLTASRLVDKFDCSMTLGKLLDNNAQFSFLYLKYFNSFGQALMISHIYTKVKCNACSPIAVVFEIVITTNSLMLKTLIEQIKHRQ